MDADPDMMPVDVRWEATREMRSRARRIDWVPPSLGPTFRWKICFRNFELAVVVWSRSLRYGAACPPRAGAPGAPGVPRGRVEVEPGDVRSRVGVHLGSEDVQVPDQAQAPACGQARGILRRVLRRSRARPVRPPARGAAPRRRTPRHGPEPNLGRQRPAPTHHRARRSSMARQIHPNDPVPRGFRVAPAHDHLRRSIRTRSHHEVQAARDGHAGLRGLVLDRRETRGGGERIRAGHHRKRERGLVGGRQRARRARED